MQKLIILFILFITATLQAQMVNIVQITDMKGGVSYTVMGREDYTKIQREVREENEVYLAALAQSRKEWQANSENKLPFQGARYKPRTVKKLAPDYTDQQQAEARCTKLNEQVQNKIAADLEKAEKRKQTQRPSQEQLDKEDAKMRAQDACYNLVTKNMGEKLGRPVPTFGFTGFKVSDKK